MERSPCPSFLRRFFKCRSQPLSSKYPGTKNAVRWCGISSKNLTRPSRVRGMLVGVNPTLGKAIIVRHSDGENSSGAAASIIESFEANFSDMWWTTGLPQVEMVTPHSPVSFIAQYSGHTAKAVQVAALAQIEPECKSGKQISGSEFDVTTNWNEFPFGTPLQDLIREYLSENKNGTCKDFAAQCFFHRRGLITSVDRSLRVAMVRDIASSGKLLDVNEAQRRVLLKDFLFSGGVMQPESVQAGAEVVYDLCPPSNNTNDLRPPWTFPLTDVKHPSYIQRVRLCTGCFGAKPTVTGVEVKDGVSVNRYRGTITQTDCARLYSIIKEESTGGLLFLHWNCIRWDGHTPQYSAIRTGLELEFSIGQRRPEWRQRVREEGAHENKNAVSKPRSELLYNPFAAYKVFRDENVEDDLGVQTSSLNFPLEGTLFHHEFVLYGGQHGNVCDAFDASLPGGKPVSIEDLHLINLRNHNISQASKSAAIAIADCNRALQLSDEYVTLTKGFRRRHGSVAAVNESKRIAWVRDAETNVTYLAPLGESGWGAQYWGGRYQPGAVNVGQSVHYIVGPAQNECRQSKNVRHNALWLRPMVGSNLEENKIAVFGKSLHESTTLNGQKRYGIVQENRVLGQGTSCAALANKRVIGIKDEATGTQLPGLWASHAKRNNAPSVLFDQDAFTHGWQQCWTLTPGTRVSYICALIMESRCEGLPHVVGTAYASDIAPSEPGSKFGVNYLSSPRTRVKIVSTDDFRGFIAVLAAATSNGSVHYDRQSLVFIPLSECIIVSSHEAPSVQRLRLDRSSIKVGEILEVNLRCDPSHKGDVLQCFKVRGPKLPGIFSVQSVLIQGFECTREGRVPFLPDRLNPYIDEKSSKFKIRHHQDFLKKKRRYIVPYFLDSRRRTVLAVLVDKNDIENPKLFYPKDSIPLHKDSPKSIKQRLCNVIENRQRQAYPPEVPANGEVVSFNYSDVNSSDGVLQLKAIGKGTPLTCVVGRGLSSWVGRDVCSSRAADEEGHSFYPVGFKKLFRHDQTYEGLGPLSLFVQSLKLSERQLFTMRPDHLPSDVKVALQDAAIVQCGKRSLIASVMDLSTGALLPLRLQDILWTDGVIQPYVLGRVDAVMGQLFDDERQQSNLSSGEKKHVRPFFSFSVRRFEIKNDDEKNLLRTYFYQRLSSKVHCPASSYGAFAAAVQYVDLSQSLQSVGVKLVGRVLRVMIQPKTVAVSAKVLSSYSFRSNIQLGDLCPVFGAIDDNQMAENGNASDLQQNTRLCVLGREVFSGARVCIPMVNMIGVNGVLVTIEQLKSLIKAQETTGIDSKRHCSLIVRGHGESVCQINQWLFLNNVTQSNGLPFPALN